MLKEAPKTEDEVFQKMWTPFIEHLKRRYPRKLDREIIASNAFPEVVYASKIIFELWEMAADVYEDMDP